MNRRELLDRVRAAGSFPDDEAAVGAAREVVCALRERLAPDEASHLEAALRPDLPELFACRDRTHPHKAAARSDQTLTEPELAERVRAATKLGDLLTTRKVIRVVLGAVSDRLGEEEAETAEKGANEAKRVGALGEGPKRRGGRGEPENED